MIEVSLLQSLIIKIKEYKNIKVRRKEESYNEKMDYNNYGYHLPDFYRIIFLWLFSLFKLRDRVNNIKLWVKL